MWAGLLIGTYVWFLGLLMGIIIELLVERPQPIEILPKVAIIYIMVFAILGMIFGYQFNLQISWVTS